MTDVSATTSGGISDPSDLANQAGTDTGAVDGSPEHATAPSPQDAPAPAGDGSQGAQEQSAEDQSAPGEAASRLEEEGDIAADYVEELLDIADIDGDIDIEVRDGRTYLSVIAEDDDEALKDLVGRDGKGLEALQELARLAVLSATGNRSRLVLDIAGHRARRATELEAMARDAVDQVRQSGEPVHLRPMGAYERKIVHDVIAEAGLVSESEGEGARRHVVVSARD